MDISNVDTFCATCRTVLASSTELNAHPYGRSEPPTLRLLVHGCTACAKESAEAFRGGQHRLMKDLESATAAVKSSQAEVARLQAWIDRWTPGRGRKAAK